MEAFLIFGVGLGVLILIGATIALIVEIPPVRRYVQSSPNTRFLTVVLFGLTTFAIVFGLLAYIYAFMLNGLTGLTYPLGYFYPDRILNNALDRELWFHLMLPPFRVLTYVCFSQFVEVCQAKNELLVYDFGLWFGYGIRLCISMIPAISCAIRVHQMTRLDQKPIDTWTDDLRKKKRDY